MKSLSSIRIVLVEPSHPGNIGGAARAMKTMGLSQLVLVNPKRFPDPQADWRAAGALDIVTEVIVCNSLQEAVADSSLVAATSVRDRHIAWPKFSSADFAQEVISKYDDTQTLSVVFGRESSGLTNEELNLCNVQVMIPSNPEYSSLNLAMAVQVISYDLYKKVRVEDAVVANDDEADTLATFAETQAFYTHLWQVLRQVEFLDPNEPREAPVRLRRLFGRVGLQHTEVQILRGILSHIEHALSEKEKVQE